MTSSMLTSLKNLHGESLGKALVNTTKNKQAIISFNAYVSFFTRLTNNLSEG